MSPVAEPPVSDEDFVRDIIPLLKEYTDKLNDLASRVITFIKDEGLPTIGRIPEYGRTMREEYSQRLRHLTPPAKDLARQASAVIEQGRSRGLLRTELWLRLAEFESALDAAILAVQQLASKK